MLAEDRPGARAVCKQLRNRPDRARRFVSYYDQVAAESALLLTRNTNRRVTADAPQLERA